MKKYENGWDWGWYALACLLTLGGAWIIRVIITEAIRKAFTD